MGLLYRRSLPPRLSLEPGSHSIGLPPLLHCPLLGRDTVCVDLSLALVHGDLVFGRTGYLLLQLLYGC